MAEYQDITKVGVGGLKGLPGLNTKSEYEKLEEQLQEESRRLSRSSVHDVRHHYNTNDRYIGMEAQQYGYGDSVYDTESPITYSDLENLGDIRANRQSGFTQVANGILKSSVLAGTTFLDGTVGLVYGIGEAIRRGFDDDYTSEQAWAGLWDNDFSKAMKNITDLSEEYLPNYYTKDEVENPWSHIFSANFIGDKLYKNMGFMIGAAYSGGIYTKAFSGVSKAAGLAQKGTVLKAAKKYRATRTTEDLNKYIRASKMANNTPAMVNTVVGSFMSAVNEGSIEAINNAEEAGEKYDAMLETNVNNSRNTAKLEYDIALQNLVQEYEQNKGTFVNIEGSLVDPAYEKFVQQHSIIKAKYDAELSKINNAYSEAKKNIELEKAKVGNMTLGLNIPLLTISNAVVLKRFYAGDFNTARKNIKIKGNPGKYTEDIGKLAGVRKAVTKSIMEGSEEMGQKIGSTTATTHYSKDANNFYAAQLDPEAKLETASFLASLSSSIMETVTDPAAWEEFLVGAIMGAVGLPQFRSFKDSNGKFRSPVTFSDGAWGAFKEQNEIAKRSKEAAAYLNNKINSPEFKNYYQGLVRHDRYERIKENALVDNDQFEFKNADHAQLVSDIMMFDNAGKLDDLYALIESSFEYSPENIEAIKRNTTIELENGSKSGLFTDENGNTLSDDEIKNKLEKTKNTILNTLNEYIKIKNDIDISTGQRFNDEQLKELVWIKSQLGNWKDRLDNLWESDDANIKASLSKLFGELDRVSRYLQTEMQEEGSSGPDINFTYKDLEKQFKDWTVAKNTIGSLLGASSLEFARAIATNDKLKDTLIQAMSDLETTTQDELDVFKSALEESVSIYNGINSYNEKFKEYYKNPESITADHNKINNKIAEGEKKKKQQSLQEALNNSTVSEISSAVQNGDVNLSDIEELLSSSGIDVNDLNSVDASTLTEEQNKALEVVNKQHTKESIMTELNKLGLTEDLIESAMSMVDASYNTSDSLDEFLDLTTEAYNNPIHIAISQSEQESDNVDDIINEKQTEVLEAIEEAINKVEENKKSLENLPKSNTSPDTQIEPNEKKEQSKKSGKDGADVMDPINKDKDINKSEESYIPTPNLSNLDIDSQNHLASRGPSESVETLGGIKQYWGIGLNEFPIRQDKGDFSNFIEALEKGKIKDSNGNPIVYSEDEVKRIKATYDHLIEKNAFTNIKTGGAKSGEKMYFYTDPKVNENAGEVVIFIKNEQGLTVGVLPSENSKTFNTYLGLSNFVSEFKQEYSSNQEEGSIYTSSKTTKVHKNMVGRIPFSNDYTIINDIFKGEEFKLGIAVRTGEQSEMLVVPGRLKNVKKQADDIETTVMSPLKAVAGQPYVLIPTSDPKRSHFPVSFRMPTYSKSLNDTRLVKAVNAVIDKLHTAQSTKDVISIKEDLQELLALPGLFINITENDKPQIWYTPIGGDKEFLTDNVRGPNYESFLDFLEDFKSKLEEKGIPFQISRKYINGTYKGNDYNSMIGELASANIPVGINHTINDWFTMIPVGETKAKSPKSTRTNPNVSMAKPKEHTVSINGATIQVNLDDYSTTDANGNDYNGNLANIAKAIAFGYKNNLSGLYDTEWGFFDSQKQKFVDKNKASKGSDNKTSNLSTDVINRILEDSKGINLTADERYYEDSQGNKYERVTTVIQQDPEVEPFDPNSPWIVPSTTIGNQVDELGRKVFNHESILPSKFPNLQTNGVKQLEKIRDYYENKGWRFITQGVKAFGKVESNGKKFLVAGTLDLLAIDKQGKYHIIDIKTHRSEDVSGKITKWSKQLTLYKQLLESRYGIQVDSISILPIKVSYSSPESTEYSIKDGVLYNGAGVVYTTAIPGTMIPITPNKLNIINKNDEKDVVLPTTEHATKQARENGILNNTQKESVWKSLTLDQQWAILGKESVPKQKQVMEALWRAYDPKSKKVDSKKLKKSIDEFIGVPSRFRRKDNSIGTISRKEHKWLNDNLPELGSKGSLRIVKGLIKISKEDGGGFAYGQFKNGIITIGSNAARGTLYHEAFHAIMHIVLENDEISELFESARKKHGNKSRMALEEMLAEDFRKYMQIEEIPFVGNAIKIFRFLKHIIKNTFNKESYIDKVFYSISRGNYNNRSKKNSTTTKFSSVNEIVGLRDYLQRLEESIKYQHEVNSNIFKLRDEAVELSEQLVRNSKVKYHKVGNERLMLFSDAKYKEFEGKSIILKDYNKFKDVLKAVSYLGNDYIYIRSNADIQRTSKESIKAIERDIEDTRLEIKKLESMEHSILSDELLATQEVYYRGIEQYHRDKYMFGNLSIEDQQYIKDRKIPISEYNKLTSEEQEILLHCK